MSPSTPKQKHCRCGCGQPCAGRFKKGHHMRVLSKRKRQQIAKALGSKGGLARAKNLTKARRRDIAIEGGYARHGRVVHVTPAVS